jgi:DNA-binding response OmpR family regulator
MDKLNILIVEDEAIVALEIKSFLTSIGCNVVDTINSADNIVDILQNRDINLIMMDIYIEGKIDGIEASIIAKSINPNIEIIFLTANSDDYNIDRAVEVEPISYLTKPFNRQELLVAIKLVQKKLQSKPKNDNVVILDNEFKFDRNSKLLYQNDKLISLTHKEVQLLELFLNNKNQLTTIYTIENLIWPTKNANLNTVRTLIKRLRVKLNYKFIKTIPSRGYILLI